MPNLPNADQCCGCAACVDICTHGALSLVEDKNCFYNIQIDKNKCVECKLCEKRCHILQQNMLKRNDAKQTTTFAAWSTKEDIIKHSATGGIFAQVAYNLIIEGNTFVYGAALQEDNTVRHIEISRINDLIKLQNSKYQQSYCEGIYKQVKDRLKNGNRVLFSGVPCQIAALYVFLNYNEKLIDSLYTIEILCHGVPCNDLHRTAIKYNKVRRIYAYRNKDDRGWCGKKGNNNRLAYINNEGVKIITSSYQKDSLFRSYLTFNFTRINCYKCHYSDIHRVADLTIGDFWGWNKTPNPEQYENYWGTSVVLSNNVKGSEILSGGNLHKISTTWEEFLPINQNLYMPTNIYDYKGGKYVWLFKHLPTSIRTIVYQSGFSNTFLDRVYNKIIAILFKNKRHKAAKIKDLKSQEILNYLNKI